MAFLHHPSPSLSPLGGSIFSPGRTKLRQTKIKVPFGHKRLTPPLQHHFYHRTNTATLHMFPSAANLPVAASINAAAVPSRFSGITHVFQLFVAFILGGIFFSTVLSMVTTFFAIGKENMLRGWNIFKAVSSSVWSVFTYGLQVARDTLLSIEDGEERKKQWKWREAWQVLKEQLTLTKKAAVEGVQAIKLEASIYSAVIGTPGLISLQYFVDSLTPKLLSSMAKENFVKALADLRNSNVRKISLVEFDFGARGPKLASARTYNLDDAIALDIDVDWSSEMKAKVKVTSKIGVTIPVTIKNLRFDGVVRVVLTPLTEEPPGFGAILVSFPKAPSIGLDVSLSKIDITKSPWLREELLKEIQKAVAAEFLWPRRIVVPSGVSPSNPKPILSRVALSALSESDPLLDAERKIEENDIYRKSNIKRERALENELGLDVVVADG
ncbi:synaptotagmin-related protein [Skeletonema marinoi]|uniref:Synaptotagmin-related protein n=1 Tax=Skeletonema marinoi TaxID=267567 RepID=A0AAD9D8X6_9STRA|nr:synaptotagmin-related protein [Skeletonema marinoi]